MKKWFLFMALLFVLASCGETKKEYIAKLDKEWATIEEELKSFDDKQKMIDRLDAFMVAYPKDHEHGNGYYDIAVYHKASLKEAIVDAENEEKKRIANEAEYERLKKELLYPTNSALSKVANLIFSEPECEARKETASIIGSDKIFYFDEGQQKTFDAYTVIRSIYIFNKNTNKRYTYMNMYGWEKYEFTDLMKVFDACYIKPDESVWGITAKDLYPLIRDDIRNHALLMFHFQYDVNYDKILSRFYIEQEEEEGEGYEEEDYGDAPYMEEVEEYNYISFYYYIAENLNIFEKAGLGDWSEWQKYEYAGRLYRRMLDDSYYEIYNRLVKILEDYDNEWYQKHYSNDEYILSYYPESTVKVTEPVADKIVKLYDIKEKKAYNSPVTSFNTEQIISIPEDVKSFTIDSSDFFYLLKDSLLVYSLEDGAKLESFDIGIKPNLTAKRSLKYNANAKSIMQAFVNNVGDDYVWLFDLEKQTNKWVTLPYGATIYSSYFSDNGNAIIAGSSKGYYVYDISLPDSLLDSSKITLPFSVYATNPVLPVVYGKKEYYNYKTKERARHKISTRGSYPDLSISPNGTYIVFSTYQESVVCTVNKKTGELSEYLRFDAKFKNPFWLDDKHLLYDENGSLKTYDVINRKHLDKQINISSVEHVANGLVYGHTPCKRLVIWNPLD